MNIKMTNKQTDARVFIYALVCPIKNKIRYIGQTCDLKNRLSHHICKPGKIGGKKQLWLSGLKKIGKRPQIIVLEECSPHLANDREIYQIDKHKNSCDLVNVAGEVSFFRDTAPRMHIENRYATIRVSDNEPTLLDDLRTLANKNNMPLHRYIKMVLINHVSYNNESIKTT